MRARHAPLPALLLAACASRTVVPGPPPEDEGFRIESADGRNALQLGALIQVLGRASDDARDPQADFELKRARPEISGHVAGGMAFNLEPNFSSDGDETEVELEEAWIGPRLFG